MQLNAEQVTALTQLNGTENIFLAGVAGSGKSTLLTHYLEETDDDIPILASTGAAAILIGGRTFNSFFGLGIMAGGPVVTVKEALANGKVCRRLQRTNEIVIDEISMLSGPTLACAEEIARKARYSDEPWGGLRVIAVGDFAQLPPVNPNSTIREWAFRAPVWQKSVFRPTVLNQVMRASDPDLIAALNKMRNGIVDSTTTQFLNAKITAEVSADTPRLFGRKIAVEDFNRSKLAELPGELYTLSTEYSGTEDRLKQHKKNFPVPAELQLKVGALVMIRINALNGDYANGTVGEVVEYSPPDGEGIGGRLYIKLAKGRVIKLGKHRFEALDAEGDVVASATNYPVTLAWALTIHKAQGTSLDTAYIDIKFCWEPGQAYVACSRVRSSAGLHLVGWTKRSIFADPQVFNFHKQIGLH